MKTFAALAAVLLACTAHAASFDCSKASSRVEKTICGNAALGRLDEDIAAAYTAARAGLDEGWRPRLLRAQREWLALRARTEDLPADMRERLKILQSPRVTLGGVQFLRIADDSRPMYVLGDAPGAAAYNRWVDSVWAAAVGQGKDIFFGGTDCPSGDKGDCEADSMARRYETSVPSPALVSVSETVIDYEQGAAHPEVELKVHDWWLSRPGRVTAQDIFVGTAWRPVIARAARAYVKSQNELVQVEQSAIDGVSTIDDWKLTAAALVFTVDGYEFNLGRGMAEVEVPWKDFGAALRPGFAAALGRR